jgi:PAS domain S-box-containing protein
MATSSHARLCQHIVDHAQDAIIFADREGIIRLWNTGAETIFGYPAAEATAPNGARLRGRRSLMP